MYCKQDQISHGAIRHLTYLIMESSQTQIVNTRDNEVNFKPIFSPKTRYDESVEEKIFVYFLFHPILPCEIEDVLGW